MFTFFVFKPFQAWTEVLFTILIHLTLINHNRKSEQQLGMSEYQKSNQINFL